MNRTDYLVRAIEDAGCKLRLNKLIKRVEGVDAFDDRNKHKPFAVVSLKARTVRDNSARPCDGTQHVALVEASITRAGHVVHILSRYGEGNTRGQAVRRAVEAITIAARSSDDLARALEDNA